jgi:hypothetical protein
VPVENWRQGSGRRRLQPPPSAPRFDLRGAVRDVRDARANVRPTVRPVVRDDPWDDAFTDTWYVAPGPDQDAESAARASAAASGLIRWGAVSCVLVPLTLLLCGVPLLTVFGAATGLVAVNGACAVLLHLSGQGYAQQSPSGFTLVKPGPHRGRHGRTGTGLHRGGRHWSGPGQP